MEREEITRLFAGRVKEALRKARLDYESLYEIRLRVLRPLAVVEDGIEWFLTEAGEKTKEPGKAYRIQEEDIRETLEYVAGYSLYAYEEELKKGFLTVRGGHRVGIAGSVILDGGKIRNISPVCFLNVRLSHEVKGCADAVMPFLQKGDAICHTLLISPPRCGKTTLLRDIIRQVSDGTKERPGCTVGVVDERSELAGCYLGVPQNDLGLRTDVLDACPKAEGMMMLVRSMSPQVVAVDELGNWEDIKAIETVIRCGCRLLATIHGNSLEDIWNKPFMEKLIEEAVFERYLVLGKKQHAGNIVGIYNGRGEQIGEGRRG